MTARSGPVQLERAAFLLSLDTELAWGAVHRGGAPGRWDQYRQTRPAIDRLLGLMEGYDIHATWAVVGHLFLDSCRPADGRKHPEIERADLPWFKGDWFDADPCSDVEKAPAWYAPDIIASLMACRVHQEIGSHTFSHILVDDPGCSGECFRSELKACRAVARSWGVELRSFVYPRNGIAHLDVLAEEGFRAYRGNVWPGWWTRIPSVFERPFRLLRWSLPMPPLTVAPRRSHGMWNLPATTFYLHRRGPARVVPIRARVGRAVRGIDQSISTRTTSHLYLHPFNLAGSPDGLLGGLERIFEVVARARETGDLVNPTMSQLAMDLDRDFDGQEGLEGLGQCR